MDTINTLGVTEEQIKAIAAHAKQLILASSRNVGEEELVDTLDGLSSMPALRIINGVATPVRAPLTLFGQAAWEAAKTIVQQANEAAATANAAVENVQELSDNLSATLENAGTVTEAAQHATDEAIAAALLATDAAESVQDGKSAYQVAVENGYTGTTEEWLASLVGPDGKSAYQVAVENGFEGTTEEWLASLVGPDGKSAYQVAVENGYTGTTEEWLASLVGPNGKSAYQVAVENGFEGTTEEWLLSLNGVDGRDGQGLNVVSRFETAEALEADYPNGASGSFEVGVEPPFDYYYWDSVNLRWRNSGQLQGGKGEPGDKGDKGDKGDNGNDGITPSIGENGNWFIGQTDTGVKALAIDGNDGITPSIGENGNWFIGETDTGVKARAFPDAPADGKNYLRNNGAWTPVKKQWVGTEADLPAERDEDTIYYVL